MPSAADKMSSLMDCVLGYLLDAKPWHVRTIFYISDTIDMLVRRIELQRNKLQTAQDRIDAQHLSAERAQQNAIHSRILQLPLELLLVLVDHLEPASVIHFSQTCRALRGALTARETPNAHMALGALHAGSQEDRVRYLTALARDRMDE